MGPIRAFVEQLKAVARLSGLTLEQVADFYDTIHRAQEDAKAGPTGPITVTPPERPQ